MKKILVPCLFFLATPVAFTQPAQNSRSYKKVTVITTAANTSERFAGGSELTLVPYAQPLETEPCVFIDPSKSFQTFVGIGGAITDASAETFFKLPASKQQELLTAYYDKKKGIGYTIARTSINSCDFSSDSYVYVQENDSLLKTFDVSHDEQFKIPLIKQATAAAGGRLNLFVSPWSPPSWMKTNNSMLQGGSLKESYRKSWANYYVKFIKTYEAKGIPIWGLSVQNEPMAKQTWESCIYTAEQERDFVKNFLGPTLKANGLSNKKLIVWDHNRDLVYQRADVILNDPQAAKFVWGVGFHWYETWTGSKMQFQNVGMVHNAFPGKHLMFTEGCVEKFNLDSINNWALGERYGHSMINDFNSGTVAWTDWNILLDQSGGPDHVGNFCYAPVHADINTGQLTYTNSYYYIGHFSKYILPAAKRIACVSSRDVLETTAFKNADGKIVVVVMNRTGSELPYKIWLSANAAPAVSKPHSITTLIIE